MGVGGSTTQHLNTFLSTISLCLPSLSPPVPYTYFIPFFLRCVNPIQSYLFFLYLAIINFLLHLSSMWSRYCKVLTYSSSSLLAHLFSYPFSIVWHLPTNIYSTLTQPFLPDNPSRADLTLLYPFLSTIYSTLPHPFLPDNPSRADLTLLFPFLSTSYFTSDLMYCT